MRFKLSLAREPKHKDFVSAVGWSTSDEVLSCGDDHKLLRWNMISGDTTELATLPDTMFPTDVHWYPRGVGGGSRKGGGGSELFVLTSTEGKYYLVSKTGRVEKTVDAHHGAVLCARWSYDGTSLLTVGEDGAVKIWSRSGMLRSTLSQNSTPVYSASWSPDNNQVLYACGTTLTIKPLQANAKATQWKAHDGIIIDIEWNPCNNLIISGGEDCKYRVWDVYGRAIYASSAHEFPITSVAWSSDGQLFAVGSYNTLRLCDEAGWSYSLDKPRVGSIFNLTWSPDGTQVAGATASGHVVFAYVVDQRAEWKNFEVIQTKGKVIEVRNATNDAKDKLELRDRVIKLALGWDHLIVASSTQCYIYNAKNFNTPIITDLKECCVSLIALAGKCFLLIDGGSLQIYGYDGRLQSSPKFPGMRTDVLSDRTIALSNDTLAVRDKVDEKVVYIFDTSNGKMIGEGKITHSQEIIEIAIDQCGPSNERKLAFIDKNNDVFLSSVKSFGPGQRIVKLGAMIHNIRFNDTTNMLIGLQDSKLLLWCYPSTAYVDKELLPKTIVQKEATEFGKSPWLTSFVGNHITVRRSDGSIISSGISPFPAALLGYVDKSKWDDALRLCRLVKDDNLWATLAATAAYAKNLNTAEIAYASINEGEKVQFLTELRSVNNKDVRNAEMALFCGNNQDAETILLQSGHAFRAIMLNIKLYKWDRALDLALKHKMHVDTVCAYRQKYLEESNRKETNKKFLQQYNEVEIDWDLIQERIEQEYQKEKGK